MCARTEFLGYFCRVLKTRTLCTIFGEFAATNRTVYRLLFSIKSKLKVLKNFEVYNVSQWELRSIELAMYLKFNAVSKHSTN